MSYLVSVITVSYNAAKTVGATLDSVRAQTWRPLESVWVDGGSDDGTRDIVARYADIAGSVVSEPDRGIYDAMNKGIALARGDILHFLNADDRFVDERVIADVAQLFAADPGLDLVYGDAVYLTPDGPFLRSYGRVTARNLIYGDCAIRWCLPVSGYSTASAISTWITGSTRITTGCCGCSSAAPGSVICRAAWCTSAPAGSTWPMRTLPGRSGCGSG